MIKNIIIGLIVAAIVALLGFGWNYFDSTRIISPIDDEKVSQAIPVKVKIKDNKSILWIIVKPILIDKYFPHVKTKLNDFEWEETVFVGPDELQHKEKYKIMLLSTNQEVSDRFDNYLIKSKEEKDWSGIKLPNSGFEILGYVSVVRIK